MSSTDFLRGMCVGLAVGAVIEMAVMPNGRSAKAYMDKTVKAVGNAVENTVDTIGHSMGM